MANRNILLALIAAWSTAISAQDQPKPQYGIKEDRPRTGSMIRRDAVGPVSIPLNLSYEQLSPEHRDKFNSQYEAISPGDEPPFPVGGLKAILDPLRKAQGKLLSRGDLSIAATVDRDGVAQEVSVFKSPDPEMTKAAAQVLMLTKSALNKPQSRMNTGSAGSCRSWRLQD